MMTNKQAAAIKAFDATAPGVGYNYWSVDGVKTEIRPPAYPHVDSVDSFTVAGEWNAPAVSPMIALALVREAACRGKEIMLWQCCACGDKESSKALGPFVSHGYCRPHAAKFMAEALAASK